MAAKSIKRSNDMSSTILATRTIVILGFVLLIGSPALARNHKVDVCHVPPGNPENAQEISVSGNAAEAHLRNHEGDTIGACPEAVVCPCWTEEDLVALLANVDALDELIVDWCELDVELDGAWATLNIDAMDGDTRLASLYLDAFVGLETPEFNLCAVDSSDDYDFGIADVDMENITVEEASQCARMLGEICVGLLP
jgi:hypothetical protein